MCCVNHCWNCSMLESLYIIVLYRTIPLPTFLDLLDVIINFPICRCTVWIHWGFTTNMVLNAP